MKKCVFLHIQHNTELEILQKLGPEISVLVYPEKQVLVATASSTIKIGAMNLWQVNLSWPPFIAEVQAIIWFSDFLSARMRKALSERPGISSWLMSADYHSKQIFHLYTKGFLGVFDYIMFSFLILLKRPFTDWIIDRQVLIEGVTVSCFFPCVSCKNKLTVMLEYYIHFWKHYTANMKFWYKSEYGKRKAELCHNSSILLLKEVDMKGLMMMGPDSCY